MTPFDRIYDAIVSFFAAVGLIATIIGLCLWWGYSHETRMETRNPNPGCDRLPRACCVDGVLPANCRGARK